MSEREGHTRASSGPQGGIFIMRAEVELYINTKEMRGHGGTELMRKPSEGPVVERVSQANDGAACC